MRSLAKSNRHFERAVNKLPLGDALVVRDRLEPGVRSVVRQDHEVPPEVFHEVYRRARDLGFFTTVVWVGE